MHCSVTDKKNNERLEYLGDAVLDLIVADILYKEYPDLNEGQLTKLKSKLVSRDNFRKLAIALNMHTDLPIQKQKDLEAEKIIGNVLEAVFGAMYYDQGYEVTKDRATNMFRTHCSMEEMIENMVDPKSSLLEWAQKHKRRLKFQMKEIPNLKGPRFQAEVLLDGQPLCKGEGSSKKRAQMSASRKAMEELRMSTN